jgi:hypothetical protein
MYADQGLKSVNLREQVVSDINHLIKKFTVAGHDVVLMMEANKPSVHGSAVDRIGLNCSLVDAHSLSSDISTAPVTHQRGTHKIDFILISPRLVAAVKAVLVLPLHDGYILDHCALCVDFNAKILFQSKTSPVVPPTQ